LCHEIRGFLLGFAQRIGGTSGSGSCSCLPRSAAARPSAICAWRSAIAFCNGGQTNFIVIQMKTANQIA